MSKSLDFCKNRASNTDISSYADRNWNTAVEYDVEHYLGYLIEKDIRNYKLTGHLADGIDVSYNVNLQINPNADFDYFTSNSFLCDGTLVFLEESILKLLMKILSIETYNKNLGEPPNGCIINVIIGNIVVLSEYDGDWIPKDRQWLRERNTVLIPLKMWYE